MDLTQTQQNQIKRARQAIDRDVFTEACEIDDSFAMSRLYGEALGEARHDVRVLLDIINALIADDTVAELDTIEQLQGAEK